MYRVVYKASCWDCQEFYIDKAKRRLLDRKTVLFKSITSGNHPSAIADHVTSTGHNMKWDHLKVLVRGRSDTHCKIKETLLIRDLEPSLNENVSNENPYLVYIACLSTQEFSLVMKLHVRPEHKPKKLASANFLGSNRTEQKKIRFSVTLRTATAEKTSLKK